MAYANSVQGLINQQLGIASWRSYDNALERLRCTGIDEFCNISSDAITPEDDVSDSPTFACKFAQKQGYEHLLALANEDGRTAILNTDTMERKSSQVHYNAIFDLAWLFGQMSLVTASGDHSAKLVDVSESGLKIVRMFAGHTRSVKTLATKQNDSSVFASGGRDGNVLLWDTRSLSCIDFISKPDKTIQYAHYSRNGTTPSKRDKTVALSARSSVTGLAFQDENTLISCSAGDGIIKIWDLRKTYKIDKRDPTPKNTIPYFNQNRKCGFSNLIIDNTGERLYASCLDNIIYCYNILTCNPVPVMQYSGHHINTFYVKSCLSKDGNYLLSGSSDQNAYIWNIKHPEPVVRLKGHTAEVTCVAWCQNVDAALVTCSDDFKQKIWRIGPEILPENWEIHGKGQAEILTPKIKKRQLETERILKSRKKIRSCPYCVDLNDGRYCENCNSNGNSLKRINLNCMWNENKRFKPVDILTELNENKNSTENDNNKTHKDEDINDDNPCPSKRIKLSELTHTPKSTKSSKATKLNETSPINSPTLNLPNYNIDGCAPHLHYSPQKKMDRDWLTKLRTENHLKRQMKEQSSPTSPSLRLEESPRTRSGNKKQRTERMERTDSLRSPLLKFFRVTNNSIMKDSTCVSKASLIQETTNNN